MPKFFHVDRSMTILPGTTINLEKRTNLQPAELAEVVDDLFPKGMTAHGWAYFWSNPWSAANTMTEAVFEYVRRAEFPERPSRYQSVFVFENLEDARAFRMRYPGNNGVMGNILVVEVDDSFRCNMPLVDFGVSVAVGIAMARSYWRGERGYAAEFWEHLLIPPVNVLSVKP